MPRKYYPIWKELKEKGKCAVAAPKRFHSRIIHAVVNEKYYDDAFRIQCDEECKKAKLEYKKEESRIVFILRYSLGLGDL